MSIFIVSWRLWIKFFFWLFNSNFPKNLLIKKITKSTWRRIYNLKRTNWMNKRRQCLLWEKFHTTNVKYFCALKIALPHQLLLTAGWNLYENVRKCGNNLFNDVTTICWNHVLLLEGCVLWNTLSRKNCSVWRWRFHWIFNLKLYFTLQFENHFNLYWKLGKNVNVNICLEIKDITCNWKPRG